MRKLSIDNIKNPVQNTSPESRLQVLQMDFTGKCNSNCLHCAGSSNRLKSEFSLEKAKEILLSTLSPTEGLGLKEYYCTCNSEYTIYKYCNEVMRYADSIASNALFRQDTNGILIPDGFIDSLNSISNNYYDLSTSIWAGNREDYFSWHRVDKFDQVMKNIDRYLTEITNPRVLYRFSIVYWDEEQTNSTIENLVKIIESHGKKARVVLSLSPREVGYYMNTDIVPIYIRTAINDVEVPLDYDQRKYGRMFLKDNRKYQVQCCKFGKPKEVVWFNNNCDIVNRYIIIRADGGLACCLGNMSQDFSEFDYGNVNDQKVTKEWWHSVLTGEKRTKQLYDNIHSQVCPFCEGCVSRVAY